MTKYILTESELVEIVKKIISEQKLNNLDEYELVHLLKMGDQRAQTEFFNRYYNRLRGYVRSKSQKFDEDDVDAIVSKSLEKALRFINAYRGDTNLDAWVITITRNSMLDAAKSKESEKVKSTRYVDPTIISQSNKHQDATSINDVKKIFEKFLKTLNDREKEIMILRSQGAPLKEIADSVGTTEGNVKWYVSNLMKRFKSFMEKNS
jgi:RNA polymerase sigma-70 factor (ECF subfamily)